MGYSTIRKIKWDTSHSCLIGEWARISAQASINYPWDHYIYAIKEIRYIAKKKNKTKHKNLYNFENGTNLVDLGIYIINF